jgi:5-amino-6-(5-phosphoribosylamino)uracil reductase
MCYNASEDTFPLPADIRERYGPFGFPAPPVSGRPYIASNFVMSLDGKASFIELKGRAGGRVVSRSREDRWMIDFLRAHYDAQLIGASTLREEPGPDGRGLDFAIDDERLRDYREKTLKLGRQKIIIISGSGELDATLRLFTSPRVEPWVLTTEDGEKKFRVQLDKLGREQTVKIISVGSSAAVNLATAVQTLYKEHGVRSLLCEGGPNLYGDLLNGGLIDEDFRTLSMQVMGQSTEPGVDRPTAYGKVSYTPETAPWFKLISLHYALPYHAFFRLRSVGPRHFRT